MKLYLKKLCKVITTWLQQAEIELSIFTMLKGTISFIGIPTFRSVFLMLHFFFHVRNFDLTDSIVDHSAAVTSVKISCNGHKIISCSADRCNCKSFTLCAHYLFDIGSLSV